MSLDNLNNLIELFANQANKQNKKDFFLEWLTPSNKKTYTWEQTEKNILKLSRVIKENIKQWKRSEVIKDYRFIIIALNMLAMPWIATGVFVYQSFVTNSKGWGEYTIAQSFMSYSIFSVITLIVGEIKSSSSSCFITGVASEDNNDEIDEVFASKLTVLCAEVSINQILFY